jgi:hypothetical protein
MPGRPRSRPKKRCRIRCIRGAYVWLQGASARCTKTQKTPKERGFRAPNAFIGGLPTPPAKHGENDTFSEPGAQSGAVSAP